MKDFEGVVDEQKAEEDAEKILTGNFDLHNFVEQIKLVKKMGSVNDLLEKFPLFGELPEGITFDDKELGRVEAMIGSMTVAERKNPQIIGDERIERITRGKNAKAERGLFVAGRAPYGYRIDKTAFGGLAVHTEEAEVVRRIFHLFVRENYSLRAIRKLLNSEGLSSCLKRQWGKTTIQKILNNETYAGVAYYRKYKRTSQTMIEARERQDWIRFEVTPIIDRALWKAAQQKMKANRKNRRKGSKYFYLLQGMVYCIRCKRIYAPQTALAGKNRRKHNVCAYRHRMADRHCFNRWISGAKLERKVWAEVVKVILDPTRLREGYEERLASQESETAREREHIAILQQSIAKLEAKRDNLTKAYIDPDIKMLKAEYVVQRDNIDAEIAELRKQIVDLEEDLSTLPTLEDLKSLEALTTEMRWLVEQEDDPTPEEKRQLYEMLHIKVWINPDGECKVTGWYTPKCDGVMDTTF